VRVPLRVTLALLLGLLMAYADSRTIRSASDKAEFKRLHPCPVTGARNGPCGGYVIDHVIPLACGGPDDRGNMQWQTIAKGKAKDRWESKGCRR
jgi:hypothetical protein